MEINRKTYAQIRTAQDAARPDGNYGAFYFRRQMLAKMGRSYRSPLSVFRAVRTKQDHDRPQGATDMFFKAR